jgi:hypothetical protein
MDQRPAGMMKHEQHPAPEGEMAQQRRRVTSALTEGLVRPPKPLPYFAIPLRPFQPGVENAIQRNLLLQALSTPDFGMLVRSPVEFVVSCPPRTRSM